MRKKREGEKEGGREEGWGKQRNNKTLINA